MNAESLRSPELPFNPAMFAWARSWRQFTIEDAAKRLNTSPEAVRAWESGDARPSVRQARNLAEFYDRPFLEFFLAAPPDVRQTELVPDFRMHRATIAPREHQTLIEIQAWAEEQRLNALDLYELLGEAPVGMPAHLFASIANNPELVAAAVREAAVFPISAQLALSSAERTSLPKMLRRASERIGVLVLKDSSLTKLGVRGLCVFSTPLPVIVYGGEAPAAQSFTMAHELGHILLRQSAISGPPSARDNTTSEKTIERWCDMFAGALLVPASSMSELWAKPNQPVAAVGDDFLVKLANRFSVSRHAMLIRLVQLGYVEEAFYWDIKRPAFLQEEKDLKAGGRAKYYGSRYRSSQGDLYTGLVMQAWDSDLITNHSAAEFMGIKNLQHLNDVRQDFQA